MVELTGRQKEEALVLYAHLLEHPEVQSAPVAPGQPMCRICYKTAAQLLEEQQSGASPGTSCLTSPDTPRKGVQKKVCLTRAGVKEDHEELPCSAPAQFIRIERQESLSQQHRKPDENSGTQHHEVRGK